MAARVRIDQSRGGPRPRRPIASHGSPPGAGSGWERRRERSLPYSKGNKTVLTKNVPLDRSSHQASASDGTRGPRKRVGWNTWTKRARRMEH
eukprot:69240-Prorocentrum_minimum.AAC.1